MRKPDLVVTLNVDCRNVDTKLRIENVFGIGRLDMDQKWCNILVYVALFAVTREGVEHAQLLRLL